MDAKKNTSGSVSSGLTDQKYTPYGRHLDSSEIVNADASPTASPIEEEEFRARSVAASPLPYVTDASQPELLSVASCSAQSNTEEEVTVEAIQRDDLDLDELINQISQLLELMETRATQQELMAAGAEWSLNSIGDKLKLDAPSSRKASVRGFVKGILSSDCRTVCFLLVSNIRDRFQTVSSTRTECMSVLKEFIMLAEAIKQMKQTTALTKKSQDLIDQSIDLGKEVVIFSRSMICSTSLSRWLSISRNKRKLRDFHEKILNLNVKLEREMMTQLTPGMTTDIERVFPEFAVGIERPAEKIIAQETGIETIGSCDILESENEQEMQRFNASASENQETHPCIFEYKNLEQKLRESLHDIYSFFNEWDWSEVANIVGDAELETLKTKALVIKDADSTVKVHDAILSKCRQDTDGMVVTSASQIRALLEKKEIKDIERITGIWLVHENEDPPSMPAAKLDLMCRSLRVLALGKFGKVEGKCSGGFDKMVFFQAGIPQLPFAVSKMKKLRYFSFKEDIELQKLQYFSFKQEGFRLIQEGFKLQKTYSNAYVRLHLMLQRPRALRMEPLWVLSLEMKRTCDVFKRSELYLRKQKCRCLDRLRHKRSLLSLVTLWDLRHPGDPYDRYGFFVALKDALFGLKNLTSLEDLPHRLGNLICLGREIDLLKRHEQSSIYLESLASVMSTLCSLESRSCSVLDDLPDLSFARCSSLEKLLYRFGELKSLRVLNLQDCWLLKKLPEGLYELKCLVELDLSFCCSLEDFCTNFHFLPSLQILNLTSCDSLKKLPEDFHLLGALQILSLKFCKTLEGKSMDNVIKCKTLEMLLIEGSPMLEERWEAIKRGGGHQSSSLKVYTKGEATSDKDNRAHEP